MEFLASRFLQPNNTSRWWKSEFKPLQTPHLTVLTKLNTVLHPPQTNTVCFKRAIIHIRHSHVVAALKATKKLEAVRRLLGHRDYTTIKIYLDLTQEDLEQELSKLFSQL